MPVVTAGRLLDIPFQGGEHVVIGIDHGQIDLHDLFHLRIGKVGGNSFPVALGIKMNTEFRQVLLDGRIVDVGIELSLLRTR